MPLHDRLILMQQGLGPRPYDVTTRRLIDGDPSAWLRWVGLTVDGPVAAIDSEISTVLAEVDKVLRVEAREPWLAHIELQSGHDRVLPVRLLQYHGLLLRRHGLPVESTVVLLRPEADGPELSGRFEQRGPSGRLTIAFEYAVVRIWERPVEGLLSGSLALLPLAPLARLQGATLSEVITRMDERIAEQQQPGLAAELWANANILMGLRYHRSEVQRVLRGVREMRESVTYQAILEEGREEGLSTGLATGLARGRDEGRAEGERRLLLLIGSARFGEPDDAIRARLDTLSDPETLEGLAQRLLSVASWQELLAGTD